MPSVDIRAEEKAPFRFTIIIPTSRWHRILVFVQLDWDSQGTGSSFCRLGALGSVVHVRIANAGATPRAPFQE